METLSEFEPAGLKCAEQDDSLTSAATVDSCDKENAWLHKRHQARAEKNKQA